MVRSKVLILAIGLLLLTLSTIIVGNKMRSNNGAPPPAVAVAPTPAATDGRVAGFDDDPIIVYCKSADNKIEIYRRLSNALVYVYGFDMNAVLEAAPQTITEQVTPNVTLTLAKERLGRFFLSFQQQDVPEQVSYFGKYFTC